MSLRTTLFASKARKRVTIGAIAGLIILVSVFFIDWIANQPVTSVINIPSSAYTSPKITYQKIDTAYFATKIPSIYQVTKTVDNYDQTNLNISAYSRSTKIEIAFVTDVLPSGGLGGLSSYQLRSTDTTDYAPYYNSQLPSGAVAFQATSGQSMYSVFIIHNGRYAAVTVSNGAPTDLLTLLNGIFSAWLWS